MSQQTQNLMKKISLAKVVLNMGVGQSGDPIEIGKKALEQITGKKPNTDDKWRLKILEKKPKSKIKSMKEEAKKKSEVKSTAKKKDDNKKSEKK